MYDLPKGGLSWQVLSNDKNQIMMQPFLYYANLLENAQFTSTFFSRSTVNWSYTTLQ